MPLHHRKTQVQFDITSAVSSGLTRRVRSLMAIAASCSTEIKMVSPVFYDVGGLVPEGRYIYRICGGRRLCSVDQPQAMNEKLIAMQRAAVFIDLIVFYIILFICHFVN
jgi:hypothetical protein